MKSDLKVNEMNEIWFGMVWSQVDIEQFETTRPNLRWIVGRVWLSRVNFSRRTGRPMRDS